MRNAKRTIVIAMLICLIPASASAQVESRRTPKKYTAQELIAKIIASEKKIHDVECHYDYILGDNHVFTSYDWGYEGGKEYFAGKQFNRARGDKPAYVDYVKVTFDGEKVRRFRDSERDKFTRGRVCPFKDGHFIFPTPNRFLGYDISIGRRTFGEILRDVPKISLREQPEVIDGHRCRVLEAIGVVDRKLIFDVRVWIDTERDFRPLKIERYQSIGGKKRWKVVRQQIEKVKLQKIDGVWFPVEGTSSTFFIKNILPPVGMAETEFFRLPRNRVFEEGEFVMIAGRYGSVRIKVYEDTVRINKGIAPEKFTIEFPHGCKVYDDYAEISYTIGEPDKEKTISKSVPVPDFLTVSELLDKFAETQDKVQSFIAETVSLAETVSSNPRYKGKKRYYRTLSEIRSDGEREYALRYMWIDISSPGEVKSKDEASYISNLWDGKSFLSYARDKRNKRNDLGTVIIDRAFKNTTPDKILANSGDGRAMGYCFGDGIRVDSILREGGNVSVRDRLEKVGASECYVLDAKTARGKYMLWIDPKHGYNLAKAEVRRREGDLSQGRPLPKGTLSSSLENVRFEEVDGVWVPMEWDIKTTAYWLNDHLISKIHDKRMAITLNPDHEALGSFVPDDIKNGAKVYIQQVPGVHYTWQDGQVVDKNGREVDVDKLIKAESEKVKKRKPKRK